MNDTQEVKWKWVACFDRALSGGPLEEERYELRLKCCEGTAQADS